MAYLGPDPAKSISFSVDGDDINLPKGECHPQISCNQRTSVGRISFMQIPRARRDYSHKT